MDGLLEEYGQVVTFSRYSPTVVGATGVVTKGTASKTSLANVVELPLSKAPVLAFANRRQDGSLAGKVLRYLIASAGSLSFEPVAGDEVSMDSATWDVLGCTRISPAATPLTYGVGLVML